jgi:hypothetical protein
MDKILYQDGDKERLLKGKITSEDDFFISLDLDNGSNYRIGKRAIISIRQGERENGKNL